MSLLKKGRSKREEGRKCAGLLEKISAFSASFAVKLTFLHSLSDECKVRREYSTAGRFSVLGLTSLGVHP